MTIFPITPLVHHVKTLIVATFDVSLEEATDCAALMVALADGGGGPEATQGAAWSYYIRRRLGNELPWRSDADREAFRQEQAEWHKALDFLTRSPHRA
jgi:hypothetical protein